VSKNDIRKIITCWYN